MPLPPQDLIAYMARAREGLSRLHQFRRGPRSTPCARRAMSTIISRGSRRWRRSSTRASKWRRSGPGEARCAGWYRGDPKGHLGQLSDELFRARRLVVDTGLHAEHWTRPQAIDFGISPAEVERYVVMPGQACAYKIGEMQILAERSKERAALGSRFSLRRFHDLLLRTGTVPLAVLGQVVNADIAQMREGRQP